MLETRFVPEHDIVYVSIPGVSAHHNTSSVDEGMFNNQIDMSYKKSLVSKMIHSNSLFGKFFSCNGYGT